MKRVTRRAWWLAVAAALLLAAASLNADLSRAAGLLDAFVTAIEDGYDGPANLTGLRSRAGLRLRLECWPLGPYCGFERAARVIDAVIREANDPHLFRVTGEEARGVMSDLAGDGSLPTARVVRGVLVVRVPHFRTRGKTAATLRAILAGSSARAAILDLRGTTGGYLAEALNVAGAFVGPTGAGEEFRGAREFLRSEGARVWFRPVVVLVDGVTRSSPEEVAAILQSRGALVVGEPTRGALGTTGRYVFLKDGSVVAVTHGWSLDEWGERRAERVAPDLLVPSGEALEAALAFLAR